MRLHPQANEERSLSSLKIAGKRKITEVFRARLLYVGWKTRASNLVEQIINLHTTMRVGSLGRRDAVSVALLAASLVDLQAQPATARTMREISNDEKEALDIAARSATGTLLPSGVRVIDVNRGSEDSRLVCDLTRHIVTACIARRRHTDVIAQLNLSPL